MKHWGPAGGSGTPKDDAQRAALSMLQNFDDSLEEDTFDGRMSSCSRNSPDMFGEPKTRTSSCASLSEDEEVDATTPVSASTALSAEAEVATPATPVEPGEEATAAALSPPSAAGAWLATLPPRVIVEAPPNGLAVASSIADDEGAGSDFVVRLLSVLPHACRAAH